MRLLLVMAGERLPRAESIAFDASIFAFTAALAIVTPLLFGIIPALRASSGVDADALKEGARQVTFGRRRAWLLSSLVIGQFAVALVLSVGGGLLVRSFVRLMRTDPGFRSERAVRASVFLPVGRYPEGQPLKDFYRRAIDAATSIPGVTTTGAGNDLPLSVRERRAFVGDPSARPIPQPSRLVAVTWTTGSYFEALGIALKQGRYLTDADGPAAQRAAVVNERLAQMLWPDRDPIGRQIRWGIDIPENQSPWMTIVGVVADAKQAGLDAATIAQVYVPLAQDNSGFLRSVNLVARSPRDEAALMADMRHAIQQLDPSLPITTQSLGEMIGESVKPQQFSMTVMAAFAALALLLAALGIYGVLANAIAQQTQEIGVRVALGATRGDVMWMVFRRALVLAGSGLVIGSAAALAVTRAMAGLLYGVRATDATTFLSAATLLAATAMAASLAPAWHAARVDPVVALRAE
jgi:putative ABC transport system permease protein